MKRARAAARKRAHDVVLAAIGAVTPATTLGQMSAIADRAARQILRHHLTIETMPKTGRRKDPPRSRWSCACGAGDTKLTTPAAAHAAAEAHARESVGAA